MRFNGAAQTQEKRLISRSTATLVTYRTYPARRNVRSDSTRRPRLRDFTNYEEFFNLCKAEGKPCIFSTVRHRLLRTCPTQKQQIPFEHICFCPSTVLLACPNPSLLFYGTLNCYISVSLTVPTGVAADPLFLLLACRLWTLSFNALPPLIESHKKN